MASKQNIVTESFKVSNGAGASPSGLRRLKTQVLASNLDCETEELLTRALLPSNFDLTISPDVFEALFGEAEPVYGCLILGEELAVGELRRAGVQLPILTLLPDANVRGRIEVLEMGSDDCLGRPFSVAELVARTYALCRRGGGSGHGNRITVGSISLCSETDTATRDGHDVNLTPTEAGILRLFMENTGRVLSSQQISRAVWGELADVSPNLVSVHIANIRRKIGCALNLSAPIRTLSRRGYLMREPSSSEV